MKQMQSEKFANSDRNDSITIVQPTAYEFLSGTLPGGGLLSGMRRGHIFSIHECMDASYEWLEHTHDYIQYCFPNREPSTIVKDAPVLTEDEIQKIIADETCMYNIQVMTNRMIAMYKRHPVRWSHDHNCKRITRILLFLKEIDRSECKRFYETIVVELMEKYGKHELHNIIGLNDITLQYWRSAVEDVL